MRCPVSRHVVFRVLCGCALIALFLRPDTAAASPGPGEEPAAAAAQSPRTPDFLFGRPRTSLGVRTGWMFARAGSDLFTFVEDQLTVDRKDFNAPALAVDFGVAVSPRTDVLFGFDFGRASAASEYRNFVDDQRLPVIQDTRLQHINLSGSVKFALTPRGREISPHAWIPSSVTPYVGAGGGALWYEFRQEGDFVDFANLHIFSDTFRSRGWAPSAHVFGGVDVKLARRLYVSAEARYLWAHAALGRDFAGFDPIDLTGFKMTGGVTCVF